MDTDDVVHCHRLFTDVVGVVALRESDGIEGHAGLRIGERWVFAIVPGSHPEHQSTLVVVPQALDPEGDVLDPALQGVTLIDCVPTGLSVLTKLVIRLYAVANNCERIIFFLFRI